MSCDDGIVDFVCYVGFDRWMLEDEQELQKDFVQRNDDRGVDGLV